MFFNLYGAPPFLRCVPGCCGTGRKEHLLSAVDGRYIVSPSKSTRNAIRTRHASDQLGGR